MIRWGIVAGLLAAIVLLDLFFKDIVPDGALRQLIMIAVCNVLAAGRTPV